MKKLYLSETDKKLAGVCGGMAEFFGIDSIIVRLIWIILALIFGSGLLVYLICWLLIPQQPR